MISGTALGGKLYIYGQDGNDVFLSAVESNGSRTDLLRGHADKFGGSTSDAETIGGITNDGSALIVFFNGQLFRVTTAGAVSTPLAGMYDPWDFSSSYDPHVSHPAAQVELVARSRIGTAGLNAFVAIDANHNLYVSAKADNSYVEKVACAP